MPDSTDMFGGETPEEERDEPQPSAAELEAAGQSALFGAPLEPDPPARAPASAQPYRVLARKYRPQTFSELIGQEAMVRTLANAIERQRLAHAFLMTGVRGVGKTSTARLIAKALNCIGPDGQGGPTIDPCGQCEPCIAIAEGRHIDVIEMDAASHTGVDDVREIIEAVRYAAVSARYKIYIIDEVHMLSRNAFNALLKTLEEPPAHVKFLFATTEADKLPVTVLSRCQRFDLRRIPAPMLQDHFAAICANEGVQAEVDALAMIAAAAEGSVRDGLSILDQAIAHADLDAGGMVAAAKVRDMLGLADKSMQREMLSALLAGEARSLLELVGRQYALGVEPLALVRSLMELIHRVTVAQIGGSDAEAPTVEERAAIEDWAGRLSPAQLHRLWQLLLKGHEEVRNAPDPLVSAQMALLRVMHASDMPDPGDLARKLDQIIANGAAPAAETVASHAAPRSGPASKSGEQDWEELVERVERSGQLLLGSKMRLQMRIVELQPGRLVYALARGFTQDLAPELRDGLLQVTGQCWEIELRSEGGAPSLSEREEASAAEAQAALLRDPLVEAAFAAFPGAELVTEEHSSPMRRRQSNRV